MMNHDVMSPFLWGDAVRSPGSVSTPLCSQFSSLFIGHNRFIVYGYVIMRTLPFLPSSLPTFFFPSVPFTKFVLPHEKRPPFIFTTQTQLALSSSSRRRRSVRPGRAYVNIRRLARPRQTEHLAQYSPSLPPCPHPHPPTKWLRSRAFFH
jgi:hypothetical protein